MTLKLNVSSVARVISAAQEKVVYWRFILKQVFSSFVWVCHQRIFIYRNHLLFTIWLELTRKIASKYFQRLYELVTKVYSYIKYQLLFSIRLELIRKSASKVVFLKFSLKHVFSSFVWVVHQRLFIYSKISTTFPYLVETNPENRFKSCLLEV